MHGPVREIKISIGQSVRSTVCLILNEGNISKWLRAENNALGSSGGDCGIKFEGRGTRARFKVEIWDKGEVATNKTFTLFMKSLGKEDLWIGDLKVGNGEWFEERKDPASLYLHHVRHPEQILSHGTMTNNSILLKIYVCLRCKMNIVTNYYACLHLNLNIKFPIKIIYFCPFYSLLSKLKDLPYFRLYTKSEISKKFVNWPENKFIL